MTRYQRQKQLSEIGETGQAKLCAARIVVVGAGGLGHPVASYLAGAGVGRISIVDHDIVERSNLHRQVLFADTDIGQPKAELLAAACKQLNPEIEVLAHNHRLDPDNVATLCADADVVIDAADSFAVTYILSDFCKAERLPLISASVLGFEGYVGGFCGDAAPSVRAVFPQLPQRALSCATAGVVGPAVGVLGSLQAQMAMSVLLDIAPSPLGQMVRCDLKQFHFSSFRFDGAEEPDDGFSFVGRTEISPDDLVIELRDQAEAPEAFLPQARRMTKDEIEHLAPDDRRLILCCRTGLRAWHAGLVAQRHGWRDIKLVAAG